MGKDIQWEYQDNGDILIKPQTTGISTAFGFALTLLGGLLLLSLAIALVSEVLGLDAPPIVPGYLGNLGSLFAGFVLFLLGTTLAFGSQRITLGAEEKQIVFERKLLFYHRIHRYPASEFVAAGVRTPATDAPGASARVSNYVHNVVVYQRDGSMLVIEHARWGNSAEAIALAEITANLYNLELRIA